MHTRLLTTVSIVALLSGCRGADSDDWEDYGVYDTGDGGGGGGGALGVGQGGAQDFGLFRGILEDGGIPAAATLDDIGFFNEHKIDFPAPDCGDDVCLHGRLGMMGNMIEGSPCTVVLLGMNTPIDPAELARPRLDLTVVLDTSGSMGSGTRIEDAKDGLLAMLEVLEPTDTVDLVAFSSTADLLVEDASPTDPALERAIDDILPNGSTNLYDGIALGRDVARASIDPSANRRLIVVSDGQPTVGITDPVQIAELGQLVYEDGLSISTIGLGTDFDAGLLRDVAEEGGGAYYFVEDSEALSEVFVEEVSAFLYPLADDVQITAEIGSGWDLRGAYGVHDPAIIGNTIRMDLNRLQLAHRTSDTDNAQGRRGGGGAIILEVLPGSGPEVDMGTIEFTFTEASSGEEKTQEVSILAPGEGGVVDLAPWFADDDTEKAFVMLNLYVGFKLAAEHAEFDDDERALGILLALQQNVSVWEAENPDADIADDLRYVDMFIANLQARMVAGAEAEDPEDPWPND